MKPAHILTAFALVLFLAVNCSAHFGMVIPSDNMIAPDESRSVDLTLSFSHPFEGIGMDLVKPQAFVMVRDGQPSDMLGSLAESTVMEKAAWKTHAQIKRPGAHIFAMTPQPYWEPAEDCFIIHYTKTVVAAFGDDTAWDTELGLETEIIPLTRPFGLYAGNLFQGVVKLNGKPVPYAEVEVEYYNPSGKAQAPDELMITQTIKADGNGVFSYAAPVAGWWGFAGLSTSDKKLMQDGEKKDIEIGAVIWVKFEDWQEK